MPIDDAAVDDQHRELRDVATAIAKERYAPKAEEWDLARTVFPKNERRFLGRRVFWASRCLSSSAAPARRCSTRSS